MTRLLRGGKGLGDALYVQAVARHLTSRGERRLRVATMWPDVFKPLGDKVQCVEFTRQDVDVLAHYSRRKHQRTRQFEDCCIEAGITGPVELTIDWEIEDTALVTDLWHRAGDRPIVLAQLAREPMGRADGFGRELLPDCRVVQQAIDALRDRAMIVQVGAGKSLHPFTGIEVDLANKTTVSQLLDVAASCTSMIGYCSYMVPLAESFGKPATFVWSRQGLRSSTGYIRQITPAKILEKETSHHVVDDCSRDTLLAALSPLV